MKTLRALSVFFALAIASALMSAGCDITSGNETVRQVTININGRYVNDAGIPERQSGARVSRLSISQSGDQLFAIDNLGARWTGTIGNDSGNRASITLTGLTSTGVQVVITGEIVVEGTAATLTGLWVEPGLTAPVHATATVTPVPTVTPAPGVTPTPTPSP